MWVHVPVVLTLLFANYWTYRVARRRISELQNALTAKKVLLGADEIAPGVHHLTPGSTLKLGGWRLIIRSIDCSSLKAICTLERIP